ncbi:flagellar biosynthetic protein FliO [Sansalvadorimonas sp. 2012CJ34-2]|uniref:Flagellar protein n=1 Tax=Parendozoicomonas callyspongiae TaxID=2942213 RepID=A0ABT0PGI0_9GAMM|nr:flagellar biosynthetic protein FliO [Sansalvadorimonas sp. 2012CJ34-2]MCL6270131.1 flagellar biosynthetic protein FliO [Sansalvadorimonas sp. 2012CJ34-2]
MLRFILACLAFLSGTVGAVGDSAEGLKKAEPMVSASTQFLNIAGMLAVVLILIVAMAWLSRRLMTGSLKAGRHIKLMEVFPLGRNEKVCLVRVQGKTLLLGVTAQNICRLEDWDDWPEEETEASKVPPGEFQKILSRLVKSS